jgi:NADH/NAD ratio-sensing transcriptional regulator Rex
VSKVQAFVMVNKSGVTRFEEADKLLISELFAIKPEDIGTLASHSQVVDHDLIHRSVQELTAHKSTLSVRKEDLLNL